DVEIGVKGGLVLRELGELALETGDYPAARRCFQTFLAERHEIGEPWGVAWGLRGLGEVALEEGRLERAARLLGASLALRESIALPPGAAERALYARLQDAMRERVDEPAASAMWEAGRSMTCARAVEYALHDASASADRG